MQNLRVAGLKWFVGFHSQRVVHSIVKAQSSGPKNPVLLFKVRVESYIDTEPQAGHRALSWIPPPSKVNRIKVIWKLVFNSKEQCPNTPSLSNYGFRLAKGALQYIKDFQLTKPEHRSTGEFFSWAIKKRLAVKQTTSCLMGLISHCTEGVWP